jgi:tetratricopeptide (TPR) repeat protein
VLYILRIASPDYRKEIILLAKSPGPAEGERLLPNAMGNRISQPSLPPAVSEGERDPAAPIGGLGARAEQLLIAISVHREPADRNAIGFQLGKHDWTAARGPDRCGPAPPYQVPADLTEQIAASVAAGLMTATTACAESRAPANGWFVDPWLAARLHEQLAAADRSAELVTAHRRAAEYWQWRSAAWPQDRRADLHDLLEARYHLFSAGDAEQASRVTEAVCAQLHAWGDLGREAELIQSTRNMLPRQSASWAGWTHELGAIYQVRGDHDEARRCFSASVEAFSVLRDYRGVARGQHSLGVLAQAQGDYHRAERHYRRSSAAEKKAPADPTTGGSVGSTAADSDNAHADTGITPLRGPTSTPGKEAAGRASTAHSTHWPSAAAKSGAAAARPPIRLVSQDSALPELHLDGSLNKSSGPKLVPAPRPPQGLLSAAMAEPDRQQEPPATASTEPPGQKPRLAGAAAKPLPRAARAASLRPSGTPAPGRQVHPVRRRTGAIVLMLALAAAATAVLGMVLAGPSIRVRGDGLVLSPAESPGSVRTAAASWLAGQVSRSAVIACDPAMCAALQRRGVPGGELLTLGPGGPADPLAANVVVATAAVRAEFGPALADAFAPEVLARFGHGTSGIQVRAVAPDGAPAFLTAIRSDLAARRRVGLTMLGNRNLQLSALPRAELANGQVDTRLLATLATIADLRSVRVLAFGDAGPGASGGVPFRSAVIESTERGGAGWARSVQSFLDAQQAPFRPSTTGLIELSGHPPALLIEYTCPSPLGLLPASGGTPGAATN